MDITRTEPYGPDVADTGDEGAHLEGVRKYAAGFARKFSPRSPVEDVAQDVVERYLKQNPKPDNWKAWTRVVTRNRVVELMDRGYARHERQLDGRAGGEAESAGVTLEDLGEAIYGPSAGVLNKHVVEEVVGAIGDDDLAVMLDHFDGRSNGEIAERHGFASADVVETKLYRAKRRLRAKFPDRDLMVNPQRPYDV